MKKHVLTVLGFIVATFGSQGTSHFFLFTKHFADVTYMRPEPIMPLGFLVMTLEGTILSFIFVNSRFSTKSLFDAVKFSWLIGLFLVSYIAFTEPAKYAVPDIASWIGVELLVGFIQFTLAGVFLGLAHGARRSPE